MSDDRTPMLVPDPELDDLGPLMQACTPLERRFVVALCEDGGQDHTRALARAGSGCTTRESLRVSAMQMWRRPRVQEAMKEECWKRMNGFGLLAVSNVIDLARSARDEKVKLKACLEVMNRTGMIAIQKMEVRHVDVSKTDDELVRRMAELVRRNPDYLDMVPEPLRIHVIARLPAPRASAMPAPEIIEGECVEVLPDPDADVFGEFA